MQKKIIFISGMHCVSCEKLLEDEIIGVSGVIKVTADRKKNLVDIYYNEPVPDFPAIAKLINKFGYKVSGNSISREKKKDTGLIDWLSAVIIVITVIVLFRWFQDQGFLSSSLKNAGLTFAVATLTGLVASLSSCLAVVGAVIIAFSEKFEAKEQNNFKKVWQPNILFHLGRLSSFFILGGLLGLIGGELNISGQFVSIYTLIIAVIMGWLGLNILGLLPSISDAGLHPPKFLTRKIKRFKESENSFAPIILGALTFFLPCGFTQSMQILALASGSFFVGALGLLFFALGTLPVLFALGVTTSFTKNKKMAMFQKAAGIIIILFSLYTFGSALALWGVKSNVVSSSDITHPANNENNSKINTTSPQVPFSGQVVEMHINAGGFNPGIIQLKKNVPVEWKIYGDNVTGCTSKIIVPDLNIEQNISSGVDIVKFTPTKTGEIPFSCWMGMVRGKFIVE